MTKGFTLVSAVLLVSMAVACRQQRYAGLSLDETFPDSAVRQLARAAAAGDSNRVDRLLRQGVDINGRGRDNATPLFWSIIVYDLNGFRHLLAKGADANIQPVTRRGVMHLAAMAKDPEFLEAAIAAGGNVNLVSRHDGTTPISSAIIGRRIRNIERLIASGADINFQDPEGVTPAQLAAAINGFDMAYYLLAKGADPMLQTKYGHTIMFPIKNNRVALGSDGEKWRLRVIELLKEKGVRID